MLNNYEMLWLLLTVIIMVIVLIHTYTITVIYKAIILNISTYLLIVLTFQYSLYSYPLLVFLLIFGCLDLLIFYKYIFNKFSLKSIKI